MIRWILSGFGMIFTAVTLGLFAMALTVGAVLWMYGRDLPDTEALAQYAPPTISRIYSGEGNLMDEFAKERRVFAPAEMIPDQVKEAFISAEDKNFYNHKGYDPRGIAAAAFEAVRTKGQTVRGASTITQQVMKNFLLGGERSAERKIKEIILSGRIEETLSKEQILELYLNEIYLGANSYGVTAAAQTYFNKSLEDLSLGESAYLAALPKRPAELHPVRNYDGAISRRNYVLREMWENGYISKDEMETARAEPLMTVQRGDFASFRSGLPPRDYFTDEIRRQLSESFGEEEFFSGGLSIRATVDPDLQKTAAKALRAGLEKYDRARGLFEGPAGKIDPALLADEASWRDALSDLEVARDIEGWHPAVILEMEGGNARIGVEGIESEAPQTLPGASVRWARPRLEGNRRARNARSVDDLVDVGDVVYVSGDGNDTWKLRQIPALQGGFMAMDVNTGRVLAMQGGFSYQDSVFNRATQATRQPGSSFKPLVYASALDSGYSPATIVIDAPIEIAAGDGTIWRPKNASNRFYGPTPLRTGIERSRNLMTVRLAQEIGMDTVARYSEKFGVYDRLEPFLANALGSQETTLFRMVAAYAMFANGGERVEPTLVDRVQDRWGETIFRHDKRKCEECLVASLDPGMAPRIVSNRERVIDAITAYQLTSMMRGVVDRGTAARTVNLPIPIAGKTGTTNDAKDVWFIGFSSNIVAGCYMGYDQPRSMGRGASGGGMCGPVFTEFMKTAIAAYGGGRFTVPTGGEFVKIDRFTGARLPNNASGEYVVAEYFRLGEEPWYGSPITGGFAMGSNLPMFTREDLGLQGGQEVVTSDGNRTIIPKKANVGTVTAGGLY